MSKDQPTPFASHTSTSRLLERRRVPQQLELFRCWGGISVQLGSAKNAVLPLECTPASPMPTCFVIQPFDGGRFDKRFTEVFSPAIKSAGLEPYRVDQDPQVEVPIHDIERGIREAAICLADITLNNPNVWFEVGFAISAHKPLVLVCSNERTEKFPFDVQHRSVIRYDSESRGDFDLLEKRIQERIKAQLEKAEKLQVISSSQDLAPIEGLSQQELIVMASVAGNIHHPNDCIPAETLRQDVTGSGFTRIAFSIGLKSLLEKSFLKYELEQDWNGNEWWGYQLTPEGWTWIMRNQEKFTTRSDRARSDVPDGEARI